MEDGSSIQSNKLQVPKYVTTLTLKGFVAQIKADKTPTKLVIKKSDGGVTIVKSENEPHPFTSHILPRQNTRPTPFSG